MSPPQESFEIVFSLQGPVEPDHKNNTTSSFSVLDINNVSPGGFKLDAVYATRQAKRSLRKDIAQPELYKNNMSCFSLGGDSDLGHLALSPSTYQENHLLAGAGASSTILTNSRVTNRLGDSSSNPSTTTTTTEKLATTSIYSHSLLEPIHVPVTRLPDNWSDYQETRPITLPSRREI